jgi:hypothetical protein
VVESKVTRKGPGAPNDSDGSGPDDVSPGLDRLNPHDVLKTLMKARGFATENEPTVEAAFSQLLEMNDEELDAMILRVSEAGA